MAVEHTITTGLSAGVTITVSEDDTATALGSGDVNVLGTPRVVALVEAAACAAVAAHIPDSVTTVGMHIEIDHLAPSPVHDQVTATATVTNIEGRRITFEVWAVDETETSAVVARGQHQRAIVSRDKFAG